MKSLMLAVKIFLATAVVAVVSVAGVFAVWTYRQPAEAKTDEKPVSIKVFEYAPEEVLPSAPADSVNQTNHMDVIYELLFNSKMGMNSGKGSTVASTIKRYGLLHYLESISGGNLKHLIDSTAGGKNLGFSMQYINDDSFYAYTYYRLDHYNNKTIVVYRTLFQRNTNPNIDEDDDGDMDNWVASSSVKGMATVEMYSGSQYRILVETWVPAL